MLKSTLASKYERGPVVTVGQSLVLATLPTASISLRCLRVLRGEGSVRCSAWSRRQPSPAPFNSLMAFVSFKITVLAASPTTVANAAELIACTRGADYLLSASDHQKCKQAGTVNIHTF